MRRTENHMHRCMTVNKNKKSKEKRSRSRKVSGIFMRKKSKCVTGFDKNFHECYTEKIGEKQTVRGG